MDDKNKSVAYHEAGHAIVAYYLNVPFEYVSIIPNEEYSGIVKFLEESFKSRDMDIFMPYKNFVEMENHVLIGLAGAAAEKVFKLDHINPDSTKRDFNSAGNLIDYFSGSYEETQKLVDIFWKKCELICRCDDVHELINDLALDLLEKTKLTYEAVLYLIKGNLNE